MIFGLSISGYGKSILCFYGEIEEGCSMSISSMSYLVGRGGDLWVRRYFVRFGLKKFTYVLPIWLGGGGAVGGAISGVLGWFDAGASFFVRSGTYG